MSLSTNTPTEEVQQQQPIDAKHLEHIAIHNSRRILFLYGSQTGCAQDVAENAAREARRMHFSATVSAMDDYDRVNIRRKE
jgi:sulfite reductase alpha subunit-like flavoprotein